MTYQDRYNSERYLDMTAYLALRHIEKLERRSPMKEDWIYRRGDVYLANLDPYIGSEQGGTRPVVVLQNNTGNFFCPTLIVAPITSRCSKKANLPIHYYAEHIHGLTYLALYSGTIKTIDKRRARVSRQNEPQANDEIGEVIETSPVFMFLKKWRQLNESALQLT